MNAPMKRRLKPVERKPGVRGRRIVAMNAPMKRRLKRWTLGSQSRFTAQGRNECSDEEETETARKLNVKDFIHQSQ